MLFLGAPEPVDAQALRAAADDLLISAATSEVPGALAQALRSPRTLPGHKSLVLVARQILRSGFVTVYDADAAEPVASSALTRLDRQSIEEAVAGEQPSQAEVAPSR
jgi:hypothetical protein